MSKRKVIQISSFSAEGWDIVIVLCDDGTMWTSNAYVDWKWEELPSIPQPLPTGPPNEGKELKSD